jgi:tripartite-type tricarboxylate transporter receptor subunit TctC
LQGLPDPRRQTQTHLHRFERSKTKDLNAMTTQANPAPISCLRRAVALMATVPLVATAVHAQTTYPDKPITLIVPYGTGTGTDALGRLLSSAMPGLLGQSMIVENKAGASAQIGTQAVARAAPDGYTLLVGTDQIVCFNPVLFKSLPYDAKKDITPVAGLTLHPYILAVPSSLPVKSVAELVALAKAKPNSLSFASTGVATSAQLTGELFKQEAKIEMTHIPYQSGAQLFPDLIEGRVSMIFYPYQQLKPHIDSGKLRVLATTTEKRTAFLPDVPTMPELGFPKTVLGAWLSIYAPAGTPPDRVAKLSEAFKKALEMPTIGGTLPAQGIEPRYRTPTELAAYQASQQEVCREVVRISGAKLD